MLNMFILLLTLTLLAISKLAIMKHWQYFYKNKLPMIVVHINCFHQICYGNFIVLDNMSNEKMYYI